MLGEIEMKSRLFWVLVFSGLIAPISSSSVCLGHCQEKVVEDVQDDGDKPSDEEIAKEINAELSRLDKEREEKAQAWSKAVRAMGRDQRRAAKNTAPAEFAKAALPLAEKLPGSKAAARVYREVLMKGDRASKPAAMKGMLEIAENGDFESARVAYVLLTQFGNGEPQKIAMTRLLDNTMKELDSTDPKKLKAAHRMLAQLMSNSGEQAIKDKAAAELLKVANKNPSSSASANHYRTISTIATGKPKTEAINKLVEFHIESHAMKDFVKYGTRTPSAATEAALRAFCRKSNGPAKAEAAMSLLKYIKVRNRATNMTEKQLKAGYDDETASYLLDAKRNPKNAVEATAEAKAALKRFVAEGDRLLESARNQLFILENLSVGATAPEITGVDLDGKEFSLSDYRGKIVFLDFWGDW